jgi:putative membrane protein
MKFLCGSSACGAVLAGALMTAGTAFAQTMSTQPPVSSPNGISRLSATDQDFVNKAAIGGLFEVESGKIAQKQAANPQVREFAGRMVRDHSEANNKLKQIVSAEGGTVPNSLDPEHQQALQQVTSQQGPDFDRNYMQTMVQDHDTDAQEFGKAAQSLNDPQLKSFAQQTLKVVEAHDKMAHQITSKMASK